ncbi:MAG TPA: glycerate kinase [Candidatus Deferrimicrobiaceae bacterium]|nr:glycerate kinase [Candidatus Deferrimicrobiaceae bacterium]
MSLRQAARAVFDAALQAADVHPLVQRALAGVRPAARGRVLVVGAGKASGAMAAAAESVLGDRIADGLVVVKDGYRAETRRIRLLEAGHPVPDARGEAAARQIRALAESAAEDDLLLVLVSGGGSALTPAPAPPITLADKQAMTRLLLAAGANINQLNAVRKHCSLLKGGQLARAAAPARVHALLLSDVIGDPLDVIASGPTAPDASTFAEARAILERFDLTRRAPAAVVERLERGARGEIPETPKPEDPVFRLVTNTVIGNNLLVVEAAAARARALGYAPHVLTRGLEGEAREVARTLVGLARQVQEGRGPVAAPACLIAGGETTVTVRGAGAGGRCQEWTLAAAIELDGVDGIVALAAGTDGTDGPTLAAGALADGDSARRARELGQDPRARLAENDSNPVLAALGDLVVTGPTNTNLLDLYLVLVEGR